MQIVPTSLVRITRYYMIAAVFYLLITLATGIIRALTPLPSPLVHWAPSVLAWVSFPIMGAYYQFFPTLQGRDLRWERLTLPQFVLANVGVLGLIGAALLGNQPSLVVGSTIFTAAALLFAAIIVFANLDTTKITLTLRFYLASLAYFVIAVILFFLKSLGISPIWASTAFLLHLFATGWAILAIMGAEYAMVPMLQLKELRYPRLADAQFYLANLGIGGLAIAMAIGNGPLIAAAGSLTLIAILVFVYNIIASLTYGPSRMAHLDISVKYFLVGIVYLLVTALVGILVAAFRWWSVVPIHLHLGLIGVVTLTIVGGTYHIVPFVVWWEVYAPKLGYEDVPMVKQLYNERSANWQLYGFNAGLILMIGGFALSANYLLAAGGTILVLAALAYAREMINVVGHRKNLAKPATQKAAEKAVGGKV